MKLLLVICLATVALARPDGDAETIRDDRDGPRDDGSYAFGFETDNGIAFEETGAPGATGAINSQGSYTYTDNEGNTFTVNYVAGENGFEAQGAHIPQPPAFVAELLAIAADQQSQGITFDEQGHRV